jgi:hypothetical protein
MDTYIPLLSALAGALVGAAASVVTIIVQAHYQNKRELTKEALAMALQDWKTRLEIIKENGGPVLPLAVFVSYHTKLIRLAEQGKISPKSVRQLSTEQDALIQVFTDMRNERA